MHFSCHRITISAVICSHIVYFYYRQCVFPKIRSIPKYVKWNFKSTLFRNLPLIVTIYIKVDEHMHVSKKASDLIHMKHRLSKLQVSLVNGIEMHDIDVLILYLNKNNIFLSLVSIQSFIHLFVNKSKDSCPLCLSNALPLQLIHHKESTFWNRFW